MDEILSMAHAAGMGTICEADITLIGATLDQLRVNWQPAQVAIASRHAPLCNIQAKDA